MSQRIAYIFTSFPKNSETFIQREIRGMKALELSMDLYSLWGGNPSFENIPITRFAKINLLLIPFLFILWFIKKPSKVLKLLKLLLVKKYPSWENLGENLLGMGFGLLFANHFKQRGYTHIHGVWATMPAAAAWVIHHLTDISFSFGAHAYDIFEHGGDPFIKEKSQDANFIHTSTEFAGKQLESLGASINKIKIIRRGLMPLPKMKENQEIQSPLKIISIGRLVEKKGYFRQLEIYKTLKDKNIDFQALIVGDGPLRETLLTRIKALDLAKEVLLAGWLNQEDTLLTLSNADLFIFTGKVTDSGDRDGFPNVLGEAMATGVPVISSQVSGVPEVIKDDETGCLINDYEDNSEWIQAIEKLITDSSLYHKIANNARLWVLENFDAYRNAAKKRDFFGAF